MAEKSHHHNNGYGGKERRSGLERRTCPNIDSCLNHTGMTERIKANELKINAIDGKNYVPFSNYKWGIGIISSILISLFSISIYLSIDTNSQLNQIESQQKTTIYKISDMQKDIEDLKRNTTEELKEIKKGIHRHVNQP